MRYPSTRENGEGWCDPSRQGRIMRYPSTRENWEGWCDPSRQGRIMRYPSTRENWEGWCDPSRQGRIMRECGGEFILHDAYGHEVRVVWGAGAEEEGAWRQSQAPRRLRMREVPKDRAHQAQIGSPG